MKQINLKSYEVDGTRNIAVCPACSKEIPTLPGALLPKVCVTCGAEAVAGRVPSKVEYNVKDQLCSLLFHPELKLSATQAREREKVKETILKAKDSVNLEEVDYNYIKQGLDVARGFTANDLELINRVYDAEEVEVNPKHKDKVKEET